MREQIQLQAAAEDSLVGNLKTEIMSSHGEEIRSVQELLSRSTSELARNIHEVSVAVESTSNSLRTEIRREVERIRSELDAERSQSEQHSGLLGVVEARGAAVQHRMDDIEQKLEDMKRDSLAHTTLLQTQLDSGVNTEREKAIFNRLEAAEVRSRQAADSRETAALR